MLLSSLRDGTVVKGHTEEYGIREPRCIFYVNTIVTKLQDILGWLFEYSGLLKNADAPLLDIGIQQHRPTDLAYCESSDRPLQSS